MSIKEFIEAAIEGGWENKLLPTMTVEKDPFVGEFMTAMYWNKMFPTIALDPEAWRAVGRYKDERFERSQHPNFVSFDKWPWEEFMMHMVYALIKGQTLEAYIATL